MTVIKPGSTIGILGGGQLGRMLAMAATPLGYKTHIYCPEEDSPAFEMADGYTVADYADKTALKSFATKVDVVTYEFENVPADTAAWISEITLLRPDSIALATAQDRLVEKTFLQNHGIPVAPFMAFQSLADLEMAVATIGLPAVAKTRRFGYDGKGQYMLKHQEDIPAALAAMNGADAILEGFVVFEKEVSSIVARNPDNALASFPLAENVHKNHILDITTVPADVSDSLAIDAKTMAETIITALNYVGVLTVEMFVTNDGAGLVVNEIAPRVHNSGHWSIEGAKTSQFTQHIRAVCGLPLGDVSLVGPSRMKNLLGEEIHAVDVYKNDPTATLHDYGKKEPRAGRKMGHVTWVEKS